MHPPSRRSRTPKPAHIFRQNQRGQDIAYPLHQVGPQAFGLIVFYEALQTPVAHGSDNHLLLVYGITVHIARVLSPVLLLYPPSLIPWGPLGVVKAEILKDDQDIEIKNNFKKVGQDLKASL